ncbi:hypothetical protein SAMN06297251_1071, partial [Fulvimarina manganoxydans]
IREILETVTNRECSNYLANSGYAPR